jgi:hypothetical protein
MKNSCPGIQEDTVSCRVHKMVWEHRHEKCGIMKIDLLKEESRVVGVDPVICRLREIRVRILSRCLIKPYGQEGTIEDR